MPLIIYPLTVIFCAVATLCAVGAFVIAAALSLVADDPGVRPRTAYDWLALLGATLFLVVCPAACAVMLLLATFGATLFLVVCPAACAVMLLLATFG